MSKTEQSNTIYCNLRLFICETGIMMAMGVPLENAMAIAIRTLKNNDINPDLLYRIEIEPICHRESKIVGNCKAPIVDVPK